MTERIPITFSRFVTCGHCGYRMEPDQVVAAASGRLMCINAARCEGRVQRRARDKAAAGKGGRR